MLYNVGKKALMRTAKVQISLHIHAVQSDLVSFSPTTYTIYTVSVDSVSGNESHDQPARLQDLPCRKTRFVRYPVIL